MGLFNWNSHGSLMAFLFLFVVASAFLVMTTEATQKKQDDKSSASTTNRHGDLSRRSSTSCKPKNHYLPSYPPSSSLDKPSHLSFMDDDMFLLLQNLTLQQKIGQMV